MKLRKMTKITETLKKIIALSNLNEYGVLKICINYNYDLNLCSARTGVWT